MCIFINCKVIYGVVIYFSCNDLRVRLLLTGLCRKNDTTKYRFSFCAMYLPILLFFNCFCVNSSQLITIENFENKFENFRFFFGEHRIAAGPVGQMYRYR